MEASQLSKLKAICKNIAACRRGDDWRTALQLLASLDAKSLRRNTILLNAAVSACGKCVRWDISLQLLQDAAERFVPHDVVSYNTVVPLLPWRLAMALLGGVRGAWDVVTFNSLALSSWRKTLGKLEELAQQQLQPDLVTFNSAICACDLWRLSQELVTMMEMQTV